MSKEPSLRRLNITRALAGRLTRPYSMRRADMHSMFLSAFQETPSDQYLDDDDLATEDPRALNIINGIAVITIQGVMMKGAPRYYVANGYATDTDNVREQVLMALDNSAVNAILLPIYSPGGEVYGLDQLADVIFQGRDTKPIHAYIEDVGASAAYLVASQATTISANRTAMIGCIGTYVMIEDMNRCLLDMGIDTRVISSALLKGGDANGSQISEADLADTQRIVDGFSADFVKAVARGRGIPEESVQPWATGQVWLAESEALPMGLIDSVGNVGAALAHAASLGTGRGMNPAETKEGDAAMKFFGSRKKGSPESAEDPKAARSEEKENTDAGEDVQEPASEAGALTVTLAPQEAVDAGAKFVVDDGEPQDSGSTVEGLAAGEHGVSYTEVEGFTTPKAETVTVVANETTEHAATYEAAETEAGGEDGESAGGEQAQETMTSAQALKLAESIGYEKAVKAAAAGKTVEQAQAEFIAELKAKDDVKAKALKNAQALGSDEAVPTNAADANSRDGKAPVDKDNKIAQAAAAMKARRAQNKQR